MLMNQHAQQYASMLAENAHRRPAARQLLDAFVKQPTHAPLRTPQTNGTWTNFGVSSLTNQANGTTMIYSVAPTPMEWTQTVATAIFQGNSQPTPRCERPQPLQPNPVAVQFHHQRWLPVDRRSQRSGLKGPSSLQGLQTKGRRNVTSVRGRYRMGAMRRLNMQGCYNEHYQAERGDQDREASIRHRRFGHWEFNPDLGPYEFWTRRIRNLSQV
jgi:hypothetical protein